jgi:hypothetical protein
MPLLDLQKRAAQIGRIRIGRQVPTGGTTKDGRQKMRPTKLGTFRFTTSSRHAADAIAELLGGTVQAWEEAPTAGQWEVITDHDQIPVVIPPGPPDQTVSQWYELWTAAGCVRRCDGVTETRTGQPCLCPSDHADRAAAATSGEACRATTRINVLIPDLPGLGVWMLESHGYYAAVELGGVAQVLAQASQGGLMLPALLRIDQRRVRVPGQRAKEFPVPALDVVATMREIQHAVTSGGPLPALPPSPQAMRAIEAGRPVPVAEPAAPPAGAQAARPAAGEPVSRAQQLAEHADQATTAEQLQAIRRFAESGGLLDEQIRTPGSDTFEPLAAWLDGCAAELDATKAAQR